MRKDILIEIGVEELPARFIVSAEQSLKELTEQFLAEQRLEYENIQIFSTPRRLTVQIHEIAEEQMTLHETARGPAVKIAKDESGDWTKAAQGFVRGQGKTVDDIYVKSEKNTDYIFVDRTVVGQKTIVVMEEFSAVILRLPFNSTMRWGTSEVRFARPIRSLVALYDTQVIDLKINGVKSTNITKGHRFLGKEIELLKATDYEEELAKEFVIVDREKRKKMIQAQIEKIEVEQKVQAQLEETLLDEVTDLIEYPHAFIGDFDEKYLKLPKSILITSMQEHQRYFPVLNQEETELLPHFIAVRNGNSEHIDHVQKGNERVLHARLEDADFFYKEDLKIDINQAVEELKSIVFQEQLGTYYDKAERVTKLASFLNKAIGLNLAEEDVKRAAMISKFDLVTNIVNEFTELQGEMGAHYAVYQGEANTVATALSEQYLPVSAVGPLPESDLGALLAVSDKLDTVLSCISVGLIPTGSQDPYALRRQALGVLRILRAREWNITIQELLAAASKHLEKAKPEAEKDITEFIKQRITFILRNEAIEQDVVKAVTDQELGNFRYMIDKALILSEKRNEIAFKPVEEAFVRVLNLIKSHAKEGVTVREDLLETNSEADLFKKYQEVKVAFKHSNGEQDANNALQELAKLATFIDDFFDNNMVMAENKDVRENRLALLTKIGNLIISYANLRLIEWKQNG